MATEEVVEILKEIHKQCPFLQSDAVVIMPPNADDVLSKTSQIHLKSQFDAQIKNQYSINIEPTNDLLIFYKPERPKKAS